MNIKAVARRAKVSTATVSRTLNDAATVKPETARKVMRAIKELNYYPNRNARSLASGRSHTLGLIVSDIANPFFPELVKGFEQMAMTHRYGVIVTNTNYSPERMSLCVRQMVEHKVDGVAIMTSEMDSHLITELRRRKIPIAFLDVGTADDRISNISIDYAQGIHEAVSHLVHLGHKRIAFISGPQHLKSARIRRDAFLEYLHKSGAVEYPRYLEEGDHRIEGGQKAMERLLQLKPRPTAVVTSNDLSAYGALEAIHALGLNVPDDVSVIGFDDIDFSQFTKPPLTTIRISLTDLGQTAFRALDGVIRQASKGQEFRIPTHLVVRASTGHVWTAAKGN
jgi:DNA-binding LacI/PurR family transcriptional regulator